MSKAKRKTNKKLLWAKFVQQQQLLDDLQKLKTTETQHAESHAEAILDTVEHATGHRFVDLPAFLERAAHVTAIDGVLSQDRAIELSQIFMHHHSLAVARARVQLDAHRREEGIATYLEKRTLWYRLGLNKRMSITPYVKLRSDNTLEITQIPGAKFKIIARARTFPPFKNGTTLVETGDPDMLPPTTKLVAGEPFYTVAPDESAVFVSPCPQNTCGFRVELVVMRKVLDEANEEQQALLSWLAQVVDEAVADRRDVRPLSEGLMTQVGANNGPRHARVAGYAVSHNTTRLSKEEKIAHDHAALNTLAFAWALAERGIITEVTRDVIDGLDRQWVPDLGTRNVPGGLGYTVYVNGLYHTFPLRKRGPPTGYFSRGYSATTHTDPCAYGWAISMTVARDTSTVSSPQPPARELRKRKISPAVIEPPPGGGANFVDVTLGVIVKGAAGTIQAHRPDHQHGTTACCGTVNRGLTNAFDEHLADILKELYDHGTPAFSVSSSAGGSKGRDVDI